MKNFILKMFVILTFSTVVYIFAIGFKTSPESKSDNEQTGLHSPATGSNPHTDFINAIFNAHYKPEEHKLHVSSWLNYIKDSLYFNSVQVYGGAQSNGSQRYGLFGQPLDSDHVANMKGLMDSVSGNQLNGIFGRINIEKMCYGQRLEYEVSTAGSTTINDGFCYQNVMSGTHTTDGSRTVLKPVPGTHTAGMLCQNIYENFQHTDLYDFVQNDAGTWFVKPVMKIDSSIVDTDPTREIVRIKVINYNGDSIKNVIIKARNFAKFNSVTSEYDYNGSYIDKYNFELDPGSNLEVLGDNNNTGSLGYGISPHYWEWEANSKIDFKVEWLGQAEVWFDKMIVDDEISNKLFGKDYAGNYDTKIRDYTTADNYLYVLDLIKDKKYTTSNILPINYVLKVMHKELERKNLLPGGLASAR